MNLAKTFSLQIKTVLKLSAIAFLSLISLKTNAQISSTGRTFYMSFMEMEARTGGFPDSLLLYIVAEKNTTAVVDNPRLTGTSQTITLTAGQIYRYSADPGFYYPTGSEFGAGDINSKRCLRVVAKDPVNIYCMNLELNRSDGTFILPYESIPKAPEFYIPAWTPNQRPTGSTYSPSEFVIVGMDNNVEVEITPTVRTRGGKTAGTAFNVTLARGQVYQVQSNTADGNTGSATATTGDLTGTRVRVVNGCGKINVFSGMRSVKIPTASCGIAVDHIYTQVFPASILGRQHVVMPFRNQTRGYALRVIATKANTRISVDGTYIGSTRNAGQYYYLDVTTESARCITSDSPVYVVQYMKNGGTCAGTTGNLGDPAIMIMPDMNQKMLKAVTGTAHTNNMNTHSINILVKTTAKGAVKLNGTLLSSGLFTDVSCAGHSYARISVTSGSTSVVECDSGVIVVAYGIGQYESYSYCAGALFENLDFDFDITRASKCPNYPVKLTAKWPKNVVPRQILWNYGDGFTDTGRTPTHAFLRTGSFYVTMRAIVPIACGSNDTFVRSKIIDILPGPTLNFPDTIIRCGNALINERLDAGESNKFLYRWQDSSANRFFTATTVGKYWVRVRDTSTNCSAKDSTIIVKAPAIAAGIKRDTFINCFNTHFFSLSDSTNYSGDSRQSSEWRITMSPGDTVRSFNLRFRRKFDTTGSYFLQYLVNSKKGCKDTFRTFLNVYGEPTAKIWSGKPYYCQKEFTNLLDSSTGDGGIAKSYWKFGDGNTSNVINRIGRNAYTNFDTFNVNLITETVHGCRDTTDSTFVVHQLPIPKVTHTINNQCFKQNSFTFTDISNGLAYGSYNRTWVYDKKKTYGPQVLSTIKFSDTGKFTVTRIDSSNYGCIDSIKTTIYVAPEPKARIAVLDSNKCESKHFYTLDDLSTIGGGNTITSRLWSFSNGTTATTKTVTKKTFSSYGIYTVKLIETSDKGCKDSIQRNLQVYVSPKAPFSVNASPQCLKGNSFAFSPDNILVLPGVTLNHNWNFGDGSSMSTATPTISYADTGSYKVVYIVSTGDGCSDTANKTVRVDAVPTASFTKSLAATCLGKNKFDYTNTSPGLGALTSKWTMGDGTNTNSTNVTQKDYTTTGTFTVKLLVSNATGCKDSTTQTVDVYPIPQANFTINNANQCLQGNSFVFSNSTNTNAATGVAYTWTLTPGATFSGTTVPAQSFTDTGTYSMKLEVLSDKGCGTDITKTVYVAETPIVNISHDADACQGENVVFNSNVTLNKGNITSYNWNFGDGGSSTLQNPTRAYTVAGSYNVSLSVTSNSGCTGSSSASPITIYAKPKADFTSEYLLSRGMETDWRFNFTGNNASSFDWRFEDGQTSTSGGPLLMTFNDTGNFRVRLIVSSPDFCLDSISKFIFLKPELLFWLPTSFTPNNDGLNETFGPNTTFGLSKYSMKVYDRWGSTLFVSNDPAKGWNGRDPKGELLPDGVYPYSITFRYIDGKLFVYNGSVTILR
jgi:gliding motility-associated-like protein